MCDICFSWDILSGKSRILKGAHDFSSSVSTNCEADFGFWDWVEVPPKLLGFLGFARGGVCYNGSGGLVRFVSEIWEIDGEKRGKNQKGLGLVS